MPEESTIFLVDDDPSIASSLSQLIKGQGYNVEPYTSVEAFLQAHNIAVPGCVILDVAMGRWNGLDVSSQLTNEDLTRQVIFITGYSDLETSVRAMKLGAVDFLTKPISDTKLFCAIEEALKRDRAARRRTAEKQDVQARLKRLTRREYQVFLRVIEGKPNKRIAFELGTVEKTIKVHRARMIKKLGARNIPDLVRMADHAGIIIVSAGS